MPSEEEQIRIMHKALGAIAFLRKSPTGGYLGRDMMAEIARRALIECGLDWPVRHGDGYGSRERA